MLEGKRPPGRRAVVYDTEGYYLGASLAEQLALDGLEVVLLTSLAVVAPLCEHTLERELLCERLAGLGVEMRVSTMVGAIGPDAVTAADAFGRAFELGADGVVLVTQRVSDEALYLELAADPAALDAAGVEALYRIGDCVAPRLLADVIFDGHRLAREIDAPDPAVPLPHLQERVVAAGVGASGR
jgi:dimethylamine/trimethylamine dehydrogenase